MEYFILITGLLGLIGIFISGMWYAKSREVYYLLTGLLCTAQPLNIMFSLLKLQY